MVDKKIHFSLVGLNGNAFNLLAEFKRQAKKEGWTEEEVRSVWDEAMSNDYDHLVTTLDSYCED